MDKELKLSNIWRWRGRSELGPAGSSFPSPRGRGRGSRGFSLAELLTVIAIMGVLVGLSGLAMHSLFRGHELTQAGRLAADMISLARQQAVASNQEVRVVFYDLGTGSGAAAWKAMQVFRVIETVEGQEEQAVSKAVELPGAAVVSPETDMSPLLWADPAFPGEARKFGRYGAVRFTGFRIRSGGALDPKITDQNNYVTLVDGSRTRGENSENCYTVRVDQMTGKVSVFRP